MTKTQKNNLIRCLIFLILSGMCVLYLTHVFSLPDADNSTEVMNAFYEEDKNTLDGVHLGTSATYRTWAGPLAYGQHGYAISSIGTPGQPFTLTKYLMKEVEKTQDPKLFIVELRGAARDVTEDKDAWIRTVTDSMKPSINRIQAINNCLEYASYGDNNVTEKMEYYIPIIKYHDRWNGKLTKQDLLLNEPVNPYKGYLLTGPVFEQEAQPENKYTVEREELDKYTEEVLVDLLDYCDTIEADVLFVITPYSAKEEALKKLNKACDIVRYRGYPVLNFNTAEMIADVGIDYEIDFYEDTHANCLGAEKYTSYLAEYIADNYDLDDHRGDQAYVSWDEAYHSYMETVAEGKKSMRLY